MSKNIDELRLLLESNSVGKFDQIAIFVITRRLLEEKGFTKGPSRNFQILKLYCDWTVHWEIDKNPTCLNFLSKLTDVIVKVHDRKHPYKSVRFLSDGSMEYIYPRVVSKAVNDALELEELRNQFIAFFVQHILPTKIFDNKENWISFCQTLGRNLVGQKILFPVPIANARSEIRTIYTNIGSKTTNPDHQVANFSFVERSEIPEEITSKWGNELDLFWQLETRAENYFVGPFMMPEP